MQPEILAQKSVPGVKDTGDCAPVFEAATAEWYRAWDISEAWLCGAVTSNIGWSCTAYREVPARAADIGFNLHETASGVKLHFLNGTSIPRNIDGYFDTVRGEDVQAVGWSALTGLTDGQLCLPGTHTKWLDMKAGAITTIATGVTGETFDALTQHSILTRGAEAGALSDTAFPRGVDVMRRVPRPALTQMLMSVRNLQLSGDLTANDARDYLSGLLIGENCVATVQRLSEAHLHIIGDGASADRYALALTRLGRTVHRHDGQVCVLAGLQTIRQAHADPD